MPGAETEGYRFQTEVDVRFRDLDALGHVNHAVYLTILEEARIRYFVEVLKVRVPQGMNDWVLADLHCKYLAPVRYGDRLAVAIKVAWMRNSSFGALYEIRSTATQSAVAAGEFVQVHVSAENGKSSPLPDGIRLAIAGYEGIAPQSSR